MSCISTHEKKLIKNWSIFVMQPRESRFFGLTRGILLDNGVTSPWSKHMKQTLEIKKIVNHFFKEFESKILSCEIDMVET